MNEQEFKATINDLLLIIICLTDKLGGKTTIVKEEIDRAEACTVEINYDKGPDIEELTLIVGNKSVILQSQLRN